MTEWRDEGCNGLDADGGLTKGRYFCVFGDGIWYRHAPPKSTPWTVYAGVMRRIIKARSK